MPAFPHRTLEHRIDTYRAAVAYHGSVRKAAAALGASNPATTVALLVSRAAVLSASQVLHAVTALESVPLRLVSQAASRRNITFVMRDADVPVAMGRLHEAFFEQKVYANRSS